MVWQEVAYPPKDILTQDSLILRASCCAKWNVFLQLCVCMWVPGNCHVPCDALRRAWCILWQKFSNIECNVFLQLVFSCRCNENFTMCGLTRCPFVSKGVFKQSSLGLLWEQTVGQDALNMNATFVLNFVFAWGCLAMYHVSLWGQLGIWSDRMLPNLMVQEAKQILVFSFYSPANNIKLQSSLYYLLLF